MLQNFYTTWVRGVACQKQRLGPKLEGDWARGASENMGPHLFLQPLKLATSNLVHDLGLGLAYQKRRLGPKLVGSGPGKHPNIIWDPLLISATVKLAISNLVYNLGLGLAYQKTTFWTKIAGVWARGASKEMWDPLLIFATIEASNFKFGT